MGSRYTENFWAKTVPFGQKGPDRIHLLENHLADVGACFERLISLPILRQRLARAGGLESIDGATAARLTLLACIHDIGKINTGFQTRVWLDNDFPAERQHPKPAGHIQDLVPILTGRDRETCNWFFRNLDWWEEALRSWDNNGGQTVCGLLVAALSHHGTPVHLKEPRQANPAIWRPVGNLQPQQFLKHISSLTREWFAEEAFAPNARPLPDAPAFQHHFLGLCTLADWIGSSEAFFLFKEESGADYITTARAKARDAVSALGLDLACQRKSFRGVPDFEVLFPHIDQSPNSIQRTIQDIAVDEQLVIIESETGSGKTEAALLRFALMYAAELVDGLYFALPTRAAASQLHRRVMQFMANLLPEDPSLETVLAVPGQLRVGETMGRHLQGFEVAWDDGPNQEIGNRRWAAESTRRFLAAQIAVGTVDQAMMAALKVKHAHVRAACLSRHLLVVDEVHASDTYMARILESLLDAHLGAGGYALLMSATLGSAARRRWFSAFQPRKGDGGLTLDQAILASYPAVSIRAADGTESFLAARGTGCDKAVSVSVKQSMDNFAGVAGMCLRAARVGTKVLVIRNTVGYAIQTQQKIEAAAGCEGRDLLFSCGGVLTLHHSRFAASDRRILDRKIEEQLGRHRTAGGFIVVGTQTLEQSLDIDADLLITDLCPMDVLLQRIGRLHRHQRHDRPQEYQVASCIVLTPTGNDLSLLLSRRENANGLGPHGYVYADLRVLEATLRLLFSHLELRIPAMNRDLVERSTHPVALKEVLRGKDEDWHNHATDMDGGKAADGLHAKDSVVRRDKDFFVDNRDIVFGSLEERIRTRLGDESIEVELCPKPPTCFNPGELIGEIAIPARWLSDRTRAKPVAPTLLEEGFDLRLGHRGFRYDRLGLRRL